MRRRSSFSTNQFSRNRVFFDSGFEQVAFWSKSWLIDGDSGRGCDAFLLIKVFVIEIGVTVLVRLMV